MDNKWEEQVDELFTYLSGADLDTPLLLNKQRIKIFITKKLTETYNKGIDDSVKALPDTDDLLSRLECSKCGDLPANITVKHIKGDASLRSWLGTIRDQAKKSINNLRR